MCETRSGSREDGIQTLPRVALSVHRDVVTSLEATLSRNGAVQPHYLGVVTTNGVRLSVGDTTVPGTDRATLATPYEEAIPAAVS